MAVATASKNPLLDLWASVSGGSFLSIGDAPHVPYGERGWKRQGYVRQIRAKRVSTQRYAFAIPDDRAVSAIVRHAPKIVEVGAGTGYWARQLADAGADVVAYDHTPQGRRNSYG